MDLALNNKVALVTGSHRGTGQIIAKTLLQEGANVLVHGMTQQQAEDSVSTLGAGIPVWGDIVTQEGSDQLLAQCDAFDTTILVNNFGAADPGTWQSQDEEAWLLAYQKNVLSAQRLITGMLPKMRDMSWARIINLGTVGSTSPNARMPGYYAAKGALANMTIGLAKEVAGTHIRVNLVSPGMIHTPEVEQNYVRMAAKKNWGTHGKRSKPMSRKTFQSGGSVGGKRSLDWSLFCAAHWPMRFTDKTSASTAANWGSSTDGKTIASISLVTDSRGGRHFVGFVHHRSQH